MKTAKSRTVTVTETSSNTGTRTGTESLSSLRMRPMVRFWSKNEGVRRCGVNEFWQNFRGNQHPLILGEPIPTWAERRQTSQPGVPGWTCRWIRQSRIKPRADTNAFTG
jgi:hypothetical protein